MIERLVISLCDISGVWSQAYVDAGYTVVRVDLAYPVGAVQAGERLWCVGKDLTQGYDVFWLPHYGFCGDPWAVLAAPCCAAFCRPGARWWPRMDSDGTTERAIKLFRACFRICQKARGWWALENPPGRQRKLMPEIPAPAWQFQPWQHGDPWVKQTYIWGTARKPEPTNIVATPPTVRMPSGHTSGTIARMSSSWKREREKTAPGFAKAFFEVNR